VIFGLNLGFSGSILGIKTLSDKIMAGRSWILAIPFDWITTHVRLKNTHEPINYEN
jgi:hypothetical protein